MILIVSDIDNSYMMLVHCSKFTHTIGQIVKINHMYFGYPARTIRLRHYFTKRAKTENVCYSFKMASNFAQNSESME